MNKTLYVLDPGKGHEVSLGQYDEETKTLHKRVKDAHYVRMHQCYAIQKIGIQKLKDIGCQVISVEKGKEKAIVLLEVWEKVGVEFDLGHGTQIGYRMGRL